MGRVASSEGCQVRWPRTCRGEEVRAHGEKHKAEVREGRILWVYPRGWEGLDCQAEEDGSWIHSFLNNEVTLPQELLRVILTMACRELDQGKSLE